MNYRGLKNILCLLFAVVMTAALSACGSGGGGSNSPSVNSVIVSGVAATGAPVKGMVTLKDSEGTVLGPFKIKPNGSYRFVVNGLTAPFYIRVTGTNEFGKDVELYSVAPKPGIANVNPLSNLIVAAAANVGDPKLAYDRPDDHPIDEDKFNKAVAELKKVVDPVLKGTYQVNVNPVTDSFEANNKDLDAFFDDYTIVLAVDPDPAAGAYVTFTDFNGDPLPTDGTGPINVKALDNAPVLRTVPAVYFLVSGTGWNYDNTLNITFDIDEQTGDGEIQYHGKGLTGERGEFISDEITAVIANPNNDNSVIIKGTGDFTDREGDTYPASFTVIVTPGMMSIKIKNGENVVHETGLQNVSPGYEITH